VLGKWYIIKLIIKISEFSVVVCKPFMPHKIYDPTRFDENDLPLDVWMQRSVNDKLYKYRIILT
jgi:hypothetical protein